MTSATSATSSISGLMSGMDTASIVSQLMQIESQPKTLLQNQLVNVQTDGVAYRDVNSSFAALASAAAAVTQASSWAAVSATSSDPSIAASTTSGAQAGSVSFSVDQLASVHSMISDPAQKWATSTTAWGLGSITLTNTATNTSLPAITPVDSDGDGTISLADAVTAINKNATGYTASAINTGNGYQLQITTTATGASSVFSLGFSGGTNTFGTLTQGQDAKITLGKGGSSPTAITSSTNTFSGVLTGTTFTVSQTTPTGGAASTVSVASNPDTVANSVKAMVDAANAALSKIQKYTDSSQGSTAPLKGDWSLISLSSQILDAVSSAVSTASSTTGSSSAGLNGLQLTKDGTLTFDASAFKTALKANPNLVQSVFGGAVGAGADLVSNTVDDTVDTDGVAARLQTLANRASDKVNGSLTALANGEDSNAKNIQSQIDDWTLRLQLRQQTLTDQFNAMETALGTLKSQSSWLTSQINALPGFSSSSKN